jgi:hypothetical protein
VIVDQRLAESDDVLGLRIEQSNRLDRLAQPLFAKIDHLPGAPDPLEQGPRRDVDAGVGGLGGEHDGDKQCVGVDVVELGRGRRIRFSQPGEEFEDLFALHLRSSSA